MGLGVATFGNHEFDFGAAVLAERMRESRFPWLAANVLDRASGRPSGAPAGLRRDFDGARSECRAHHAGSGADLERRARGALRRSGRGGPRRARRAGAADPQGGGHAPAAPRGSGARGHPRPGRDPGRARPRSHAPRRRPRVIVKAGSDALNVGQVEYEIRCGAVIARRQRLIPVDERLAEATTWSRARAEAGRVAGPGARRDSGPHPGGARRAGKPRSAARRRRSGDSSPR